MSFLNFKIYDNFSEAILKKLGEAATNTEHALAVQAAKDTEKYVPALTKSLINRTQVLGNMIIYPGPYARYLYNGKVMVDSVTGKGPARFVDKLGNERYRFRKGATLRPTARPLKYNKTVNKLAQSHWFEASKAQNLDKWVRIAGEEFTNELGK